MDLREVLAIKKAADIAARVHYGKLLEDGMTPFILHPARVAGLAAVFGGTYREIAAAWLHDVLEEDPHAESLLAYTLSGANLPGDDAIAIYRMVKALTRNPGLKEEDQLKDTLERILEAPPGATLVKLCSRIDRLLDVEKSRKRDRYLAETFTVLTMLFGRAVESGYAPCHELLRRFVAETGLKQPGS